MARKFINVSTTGSGHRRVILLALLIVGTLAAAALATGEDPQTTAAEPAAPAEPTQLPPSTNPTQRVLFPKEGQAEEQQMADQLACYRWAGDQTSWDPYEAYDVLVEKGYAVALTEEQAQGGLVRGAARGAAAGVIIGAIAGDAGKGAAIGAAAGGMAGRRRSRQKVEEAESADQLAIDEYNRQLEKWDRNYAACMGGKDYTVE